MEKWGWWDTFNDVFIPPGREDQKKMAEAGGNTVKEIDLEMIITQLQERIDKHKPCGYQGVFERAAIAAIVKLAVERDAAVLAMEQLCSELGSELIELYVA